MDKVSILIEFLKSQRMITALEKDILDTWNEYQKNPLDMDSANRQIVSNYGNHSDIYAKVNSLPTTVSKPRNQITEIDLRYILGEQLLFLVDKRNGENKNGSIK